MALDMPALEKRVADLVKSDMTDTTNGGAFISMASQGSALPGYVAWEKAWRKLVDAVGVKMDPIRGGIKEPVVLKPEGVSDLTLSEMRRLVDFAAPDNTAVRTVASSQAGIFLTRFYAGYGPEFNAIAVESSKTMVANKLTSFWRKYVGFMADLSKDDRYSAHKGFIEGMNLLAKDSSFCGRIKIGMAQPADYTVNSDALGLAVGGYSGSGLALAQINGVFSQMKAVAAKHSHGSWEQRLASMETDFAQNVQPALDDFKAVNSQLCMAQTAAANRAGYRKYT